MTERQMFQQRAATGPATLNYVTGAADWLAWTIKWLAEDSDARSALLSDVSDSILAACGEPKAYYRRCIGREGLENPHLVLSGLAHHGAVDDIARMNMIETG